MRDQMMEHRRVWFTEELAKGNFPEDVTGFYESLNKPADAPEEQEASKGKKGKGKANAKGKGKNGKGKGKGKKKKAAADDVAEVPPALMGPTAPKTQQESIASMNTVKQEFDEKWYERDERENLKQ